MLPPNALTIPRTELPMKQLLNLQGLHVEGFNQRRISFFFQLIYNIFVLYFRPDFYEIVKCKV